MEVQSSIVCSGGEEGWKPVELPKHKVQGGLWVVDQAGSGALTEVLLSFDFIPKAMRNH